MALEPAALKTTLLGGFVFAAVSSGKETVAFRLPLSGKTRRFHERGVALTIWIITQGT